MVGDELFERRGKRFPRQRFQVIAYGCIGPFALPPPRGDPALEGGIFSRGTEYGPFADGVRMRVFAPGRLCKDLANVLVPTGLVHDVHRPVDRSAAFVLRRTQPAKGVAGGLKIPRASRGITPAGRELNRPGQHITTLQTFLQAVQSRGGGLQVVPCQLQIEQGVAGKLVGRIDFQRAAIRLYRARAVVAHRAGLAQAAVADLVMRRDADHGLGRFQAARPSFASWHH